MKNFTRAKKIGNEDFQQNGNVLGVSGTIETNVRPLSEIADESGPSFLCQDKLSS